MTSMRRLLSGLLPSRRYSVRIRSLNKFGVSSDWSEALEFVTPADDSVPKAPQNLLVDFDTPDLILEWDRVEENIDNSPVMDFSHYSVNLVPPSGGGRTYETNQNFFILPFRQNSTDFGTPQPDFSVSIRAVDIDSKASDSLTGGAINVVPKKPQDPSGFASFTMMTVSMAPHPDDIDIKDYIVERSETSGSGFSVVATTPGDTYIDTGAESSTYYFRYKVRDVFEQQSPYSEELSLSISASPGLDTDPPAAVQDFASPGTGIDDATGRPYIDFSWSPNVVDTDLSHFEMRAVRTSDSFVRSVVIGPGASTYRLENLEENTQYSILLYAYDYLGNRSDPSVELTVTTPIDDSAPPTPQGQNAIGGYRHITVMWDSVTHPRFSHYEVYANQVSGFIPAPEDLTFEGNATRYLQVTGDAETWYFRVRAVNNNGAASPLTPEFSAQSDAGLDLDTVPPADPDISTQTFDSGTTVNALGFYQTFLDWSWADNSESDMHFYEVRYSSVSSTGPWTYVQTSESAVRISPVEPGKVIHLGVRAMDTSLNLSGWVITEHTVPSTTVAPDAPTMDAGNTGVQGPDFRIAWNHAETDDHRDYRVRVYPTADDTITRDFFTSDKRFTFTFTQNQAVFDVAVAALTFEIRAVNKAAVLGAEVTQLLTNTSPGSFTVSRSGQTSSVNLSWTLPSGDDIKHYLVQRRSAGSGSYVTIATVTSRSYVDTPDAADYDYNISAVDMFNQTTNSTLLNQSVTAAFTPDTTPPDTPTSLLGYPTTGLDSVDGSRAWIDHRWTAPTDPGDFSHYLVTAVADGQTVATQIVVGISNTQTRFGNLLAGLSHTLDVRSVDTNGNTSAAYTVSITTAQDTVPPATPTGLVTSGSIESVNIEWSPVADSDMSYYDLHMDTVADFTPSASTLVYSGPATVHAVVLPSGTTRHFRVRAVDAAGNGSTYATSVSGTSLGVTSDTTPPSDVTGLDATGSTYFHGDQEFAEITTSWTEATDNVAVAEYVIRYKESSGGVYEEIIVGINRYTFTGLKPGVAYFFAVKAIDTAGNRSTDWSTEVNHTVVSESDVTPSTVAWATPAVEALGPGTIKFTWNPVTNTTIKDYEITVATNSSFTTDVRTNYTDGNHITISGTTGITYYARVRAHSVYGVTGAWSTTELSESKLVEEADIVAGAITAEKISADAISAGMINAGTLNTGDITVASKLIIGTGGIMQSANYDATGTGAGWLVNDTTLDMRQGSIILAGNTGLNINTTTDQMWFGAATFADAAWRVDSTGAMRVGTSDSNFNVLNTGELRIGANTTTAPVRITNAGIAEFRNIRIMPGTTPPLNTNIIEAGTAFIVRHTGTSGIYETNVGGAMNVTGNINVSTGNINLTGTGSINLSTGDLNVSGGNIIVSSGRITNDVNYDGTGTVGYRLNPDGTLVASGADITGSITVGENSVIDGQYITTGTISANKLNISVGGGNIVPNSSFEDIDNIPNINADPGVYASRASVNGGFDGLKAIRLTYIADGGSSDGHHYALAMNAMTPGSDYRGSNLVFSVWMRASTANQKTHITIVPRSGGTYYWSNRVVSKQEFIDTANQWVRIYATGLVPDVVDPVDGFHFRFGWHNSGSAPVGETLDVDAVQIEFGDIPTSYTPKTQELLPGTIVADMIAADAITANMINTGSLVADIDITSGLIRAGSTGTGARVVLNSSGMQAFDGSNVETVFIGTDGNARFAGSLTAASGTFTGDLTGTSMALSGNLDVTGAVRMNGTTGARVHMTSTGIAGWDSGGTQVFTLDATTGALTSSSATITGAITATSGAFTGTVTIDAGGSLVAGGTTLGPAGITMEQGSINIGLGKFVVTAAGALTATEATITGEVTATSGSFSGSVTTGDLTATGGTIGGITINSTNLSGGTISGSTFNIGAGGIVFTGNGNITWDNTANGGIQLAYSGFINNSAFRADNTTGWQLSDSGLVINEGSISAQALQIGVSSENLIRNSAFTEGSTVATDWASTLGGGATATFSVSDTLWAFLGKSQRMQPTAAGTWAGVRQDVTHPSGSSFVTDETIAISFWVRQVSGTARTAKIFVQTTGGATLWDGNNTTLIVGAWTRVAAVFRLSSAQSTVRVSLRINNPESGTDFHIDGAQMQLSDFVTDYAPRALEIPTNYIQSANIASLTAGKITSGQIATAELILTGAGTIRNDPQTWAIDENGAIFENGSVTLIGGVDGTVGYLKLDSTSLRLVAGDVSDGGTDVAANTKFKVDGSGVYIGGNDAATAQVYFDTTSEKTIFQSSGTGYAFTIDTDPADGRVLKLTTGGGTPIENFYLNTAGEAYFLGGVISGNAQVDPETIVAGKLTNLVELDGGGLYRVGTGGAFELDGDGLRFWDNPAGTGLPSINLDANTGDAIFSGIVSGATIELIDEANTDPNGGQTESDSWHNGTNGLMPNGGWEDIGSTDHNYRTYTDGFINTGIRLDVTGTSGNRIFGLRKTNMIGVRNTDFSVQTGYVAENTVRHGIFARASGYTSSSHGTGYYLWMEFVSGEYRTRLGRYNSGSLTVLMLDVPIVDFVPSYWDLRLSIRENHIEVMRDHARIASIYDNSPISGTGDTGIYSFYPDTRNGESFFLDQWFFYKPYQGQFRVNNFGDAWLGSPDFDSSILSISRAGAIRLRDPGGGNAFTGDTTGYLTAESYQLTSQSGLNMRYGGQGIKSNKYLNVSGFDGIGLFSETGKISINSQEEDITISPKNKIGGGLLNLASNIKVTGAANISGETLVGATDGVSNSTTEIGCQLNAAGYLAARRSNIPLYLNRAGSTGTIAMFRYDGSDGVGSIGITTSSTSYNTSSDYRLKEHDVQIVGAMDMVSRLRPIDFAWKVDGEREQGFFAHEVQEVIPQAVTGEKDAVDEDGEIIKQQMDNSKLIPLLTAALQEAMHRIEALEVALAEI